MNFKSSIFYALFVISAAVICSCDGGNKNKNKAQIYQDRPVTGKQYIGDSLGNGVQNVYKNSILVSEIPMKNKDAHGLAKQYYDDGKLHLEVNYNTGMRDGMTTEYYDSGEKRSETPYKLNKIDGICYHYKRNGSILYEAPYAQGMPIPGIKEYESDGKLIEQPTVKFVVKGRDLTMRLSNNDANATFYELRSNEMVSIPSEQGVGKMSVKKGVKVRAVYKTQYGNKAAVDAQY